MDTIVQLNHLRCPACFSWQAHLISPSCGNSAKSESTAAIRELDHQHLMVQWFRTHVPEKTPTIVVMNRDQINDHDMLFYYFNIF
jgi:hypothetical protein